MRTVGDVVSSGAKIAAHAAQYILPLVGLGKEKKPNEWNTLVAKIRKEHGLTLKDALKHIKAHNLYEKKTKTKTGGAARFPFSDASVNANLRPAIVPETRRTGNVRSLKYSEGADFVRPRRGNKKLLAIEDMPRANEVRPRQGKKLLAIEDIPRGNKKLLALTNE